MFNINLLPPLLELCIGDKVIFEESLERTVYNKYGDRMALHRDETQLVSGTVTGKTKSGRIRLENCEIEKNWSIRHVAKISRKREGLFKKSANLKRLNAKSERGELVDCSLASQHPDASKMWNMANAVGKPSSVRRNPYTAWNDGMARAIHDDTAREEKRERHS